MLTQRKQTPTTALEIEKISHTTMMSTQDVVISQGIELIKEIGKKITEQYIKHYEERKEFLNAEIQRRQEWIKNYEEKRRQIMQEKTLNWFDVIPFIPEGERLEASTHEKFIPSLESERNTIFQFTLPKYKKVSFESTMHEFQGLFQKDIVNFKSIENEVGSVQASSVKSYFTPYMLFQDGENKEKIFRCILLELTKIMTLYFTTWGADSKAKEVQNWLESFLQAYSYYGINEGIKEFLKSDKASADYSFKLQSLIPFIEKRHKEGLALIANINWLLETSAETKRIN
jgi:hypothetical protein